MELEPYTRVGEGDVPGSIVVTDLNECNHSVQQFDTGAEYEELRKQFCAELRDENEFVEDAITQQRLRISEQFVLMRVVELSGEKARPDWKRMDKVKDLVRVLVEGSPDRTYGTHHAQPCLVVAGPGAGKTWMLKQLAYLVSSNLYMSNELGIRLLPIVVFVQRIVRYLRDTNTPMRKLVKKRCLFTWYIKQAHTKSNPTLPTPSCTHDTLPSHSSHIAISSRRTPKRRRTCCCRRTSSARLSL